MKHVRLPVVCGLGKVLNDKGEAICMTRKGVMAYGKRTMPADLKKMGFKVGVWECDTYFRMSFGRDV